MTLDQVLDRLRLHLSGHAPTTLRGFLVPIRRFGAKHPDPGRWSADDAFRFLDDLRTEQKAPATLAFYAQAIRRLYRTAGLEAPPLRTRVTARDVMNMQAPQLSRPELEVLIEVSRRSPWPEDASLVALATVYGFRQGEIRLIRAEDLDLEKGLLVVPAAKGNAPRGHRIPEVIRPVLRAEYFARPRSQTEMWATWHALAHRAGIPPRARQGWHSVRRGLEALLEEAGVTASNRNAWMGRGPWSMSDRYAMRRGHELDELIFSRHPLLATWRRVLGGQGR